MQLRAEKGEKLLLSSSIIYRGVQELVNQQGRLYSPVSNDPAVLELFPSLDVSVLSPSHTGASTASLLFFAALFVPAEMVCAAHSELVMGFPAGKASSHHNTTVRIFFGAPLASLGQGQGQGWLCGGAVGIGLICSYVVPAAEMVSGPLRTKCQQNLCVLLPCGEEFLPPEQDW